MKNLLLIIFCLFCLLVYCQDDTNYFIGTSDDYIDNYILQNTIKVENQDKKIFKVWVFGKIESKNLKSAQSKLHVKYKILKLKKVYSTRYLFYVDCRNTKVTTCRSIYYDKNGTALVDTNSCEYEEKYEDVIPGSYGEIIYKYVCNCANKNVGK